MESTYSQTETGTTQPGAEIIAKLIQHTDIDPVWLLTGLEDPLAQRPQWPAYVSQLDQPEDKPVPKVYKVISKLPGGNQEVTTVTEEEMEAIHQLLIVFRIGKKSTIAAIKGNLNMAVELCEFQRADFADIIILDRSMDDKDPIPGGRETANDHQKRSIKY